MAARSIFAISAALACGLLVQIVALHGSSQESYGPPPGSFTPGPWDLDRAIDEGPPCANTDLTANKQVVLDFYQKVFGNKQYHLISNYIAYDVINHNPDEMDGRDSLLQLLDGPFGQNPPGKVDIRRVSAEGDLVWTHVRFPAVALNKTFAIIDIFRINCDGLIQEHWDVLQDTNVNTTNPHPFF